MFRIALRRRENLTRVAKGAGLPRARRLLSSLYLHISIYGCMHSARTWSTERPNNGSSSASASIGRGSTIFAQGSPTSSRGTISARSRFFSRAKAATGNSLALFNFLTQLPVPGAHARHGHIGSAAVPVFLAGSKRTCSPSRASSSMNTSGASTARARSTKSTRLRTSTSRERSCARAPNCRAKSFSAWAGGSYDRRAAEGQDLWPRRGYRRAQQDRRGRHGRRRVDDLTRDKRSPGQGGRPGLPYQRGDRRERSPGSE